MEAPPDPSPAVGTPLLAAGSVIRDGGRVLGRVGVPMILAAAALLGLLLAWELALVRRGDLRTAGTIEALAALLVAPVLTALFAPSIEPSPASVGARLAAVPRALVTAWLVLVLCVWAVVEDLVAIVRDVSSGRWGALLALLLLPLAPFLAFCRYALAAPSCALEGGVYRATRRSRALTEGCLGTIFGLLALTTGLGFFLVGMIVGDPKAPIDSRRAIATASVWTFFAPWQTAVLTVAFLRLRASKATLPA